MVFQEIKGEQLLDVTVGVFRMNKDYFKRIKKRETRSDLFYSDYALESNTVTVPINQRRPALSHLKNRIANHIPINRILIWG
jgi:spore photoproduct lyase